MARFNSIEDMEKAAKRKADWTVAIKFGSHWLEVRWMAEAGHWFRYQWGKNLVSREVAKNILEANVKVS